MTYPWVDEPGRREPESRYPWHEDDGVPVAPQSEPLYRPGGERRVQLLRRIDPWSTLKVSLVLYLCLLAVVVVVGTGLWAVGRQTGFLADLENLMEDLVLGTPGSYHFRGGEVLVMSAIVGPILAVVAALVTTAGAAIYNVVARLTGGLEVTVKDSG
ncbi:MAG: DUF3566 domain-containing protein [Acidimicrobiia bacterium]